MLALLADWRLNPYHEIIATVSRAMIAGAMNVWQAGCLQNIAINLIPADIGFVPATIGHSVTGFLELLPYMGVGDCATHLTRATTEPGGRLPEGEL